MEAWLPEGFRLPAAALPLRPALTRHLQHRNQGTPHYPSTPKYPWCPHTVGLAAEWCQSGFDACSVFWRCAHRSGPRRSCSSTSISRSSRRRRCRFAPALPTISPCRPFSLAHSLTPLPKSPPACPPNYRLPARLPACPPAPWSACAQRGRRQPERPAPRWLQKYRSPDALQQIANTRLHRRALGQTAQAEPSTIM